MVSYFHNFAIIYYNDLVGIANSAEPMGDNYACSSVHEPQESPLDANFCACIDAACGFVQYKYCRIR